MKTFSIYVLSSPSGLKYVGYTSRNPLEVWADENNYSGCHLLNQQIEMYGRETFKIDVIKTNLTAEEADKLDKQLIAENKEAGISMNITDGGIWWLGKRWWTNGKENKFTDKCPNDFYPGFTKQTYKTFFSGKAPKI